MRSEKEYIVTRKIKLIPICPDKEAGRKKVLDYAIRKCDEQIQKLELKQKTDKNIKEITTLIENEEIEEQISILKNEKDNMLQTGEINNRYVYGYTYSLLQDAMKSEAEMKNYLLSAMFSEVVLSNKEPSEAKKALKELWNSGIRKKGSKLGSLYDNTEIESPLEGYGTSWSKEIENKFWDAMKKGLAHGYCTLPNYKVNSPITLAKAHMGFTHEYDSPEEFIEHMNDDKLKVKFNFGKNGNATIAQFEIVFGNVYKSYELRSCFAKIFTGEYSYCGSKIKVDGKNIILDLTIKMPKVIKELDKNVVVGVDLGIAIPAMCALNNNEYVRLKIGSAEEFLRVRTKIQAQRRRLQLHLKNSNGGHGRKKKLKPIERFSEYETHFVESYSHMVSKRIVDFALKHNAKYINLECLKGYDTSKFILKNWSYYKLQQYIEYKAAKYEIEVRKVNPCYTSQVCSFCGHWEAGQRKNQSGFICGNPKCKSKGCIINADFNGARNIAKSTLWYDGDINEAQKKNAREFYGISDTESEEY